MDLLLGFLFYFIDLFVSCFPVPHCLDYCGFVVSPEIPYCHPANFIFLSVILAVLGLLSVRVNFRIVS